LVAGLQVAGPESALGIPWKPVIIARGLTLNLILKLTRYARSQLFMFQHCSEQIFPRNCAQNTATS
jgi:hypothetical protein